jgi:hypothetical protein
MPKLSSFSLPAFIQDFAPGSPNDIALKKLWNTNVEGWITQATPAPPSYFYDPTKTDIPTNTPAAPVQWNAFPGRLIQFYAKNKPGNTPVVPANKYALSLEQLLSLADTGYYRDSNGTNISFGQIPATLCPAIDWSKPLKNFGPYGPRGWLDEYCEWSTTRDRDGNLLRIDFCCENPEYWYSLWKISPETVAAVYESTLNYDAPPSRKIKVTVADLAMPFNDPDTGRPAYNPLNKWNSGPGAVRGFGSSDHGGAMHLTSTPNTLQTELGLAGAATVQWQAPDRNDPQSLICCGQYGQQYRNSDPHIGFSVNQIVAGVTLQAYATVCLADPVGLYLQYLLSPQLFTFAKTIDRSKLPAGASASDIFQVVRGQKTLKDPVTNSDFNGNFILHAICQIPSKWLAVYPKMTLSDILIGSAPLHWAGQVALQFNVGLYARPLTPASKPPAAPCASGVVTPGAPQQCLFTTAWNGYYPVIENAPTGVTMSLASNTTFIAPRITPNGQPVGVTITCNPISALQKVVVLQADGVTPDPTIRVSIDGTTPVTYAVPGNSYPSNYTAVNLTVTVPKGAPGGLRTIAVTDAQGGTNALPAAIYILS